MRCALVAAAVLLSALAGPPASAQGPRPARRTVVGVVVDSTTGKALAGAVVYLGNREIVTDSAGRFTLERIPDGRMTLSASQLGYADRDLDVMVGEGSRLLTIALAPDPVKLQAITVMTDRFRSRRNAVPISVRAFDREDLLSSGEFNLQDFLAYRGGMIAHLCHGGERSLGGGPFGATFGWTASGGALCVLVRGQWIEPQVWINERPAFSDELTAYSPADLFLVEVYGRGRMIRAYTSWWVESTGRRPLDPIWF